MNKSEQINELATALSKAQGDFVDPEKDKKNPFFNSEYTTLGAVLRSVRPILAKHGLSLVQVVNIDVLETCLLHSSGQWIADVYPLRPAKTDPQGFGSCLTYARRYAVKAVLGLAEEDDDGNDHADKKPQAQPRTGFVAKAAAPSLKLASQQAKPLDTGALKVAEDIKAAFPNAKPVDSGEYVVTVGNIRLKGKKLKECNENELRNTVAWFEEQVKNTRIPLQGAGLEFVTNAKHYLENKLGQIPF
jgi:hypothetical protein